MAEEQSKIPDKSLARRDRQAQALRQNLLRRKAQMRGRTKDDTPRSPAAGAKDKPSQG